MVQRFLYVVFLLVLFYNHVWFCKGDISLVSGESDLFITEDPLTVTENDVGVLASMATNEERIANLTDTLAELERELALSVADGSKLADQYDQLYALMQQMLGETIVGVNFAGCVNATNCACASYPCQGGWQCSNEDSGASYSCHIAYEGATTVPTAPYLRTRSQMIDPSSFEASGGDFTSIMKFGRSVALSMDGLMLAVFTNEGPIILSPHVCFYTRSSTAEEFLYSYCAMASGGGGNIAGEMKMTADTKTIFITEEGWPGASAYLNRIAVLYDDGFGFKYTGTVEVQSNSGQNTYFGRYGAFDFTDNGNVLVVGVDSYASGYIEGGFVDIYAGAGGSYAHQQGLTGPIELQKENLRFGHGIALSGDGGVMAVAIDDSIGNNAYVCIYLADAHGVYGWTQTIQLYTSTGTVNLFGQGMAMAKDASVIVVSEPNKDVFSVLRNPDGTYSETPQLFPLVGQSGEWIAISHDGYHMALGDKLGETVSTYYREDTSSAWIGLQSYAGVTASPQPSDLDEFGWHFAFNQDGTVLAVGAPFSDVYNAGVDTVLNTVGVLYIYEV